MYFVRYIVSCIQHLKYVIQSRPMIKSEFIAFTAEYSAESGSSSCRLFVRFQLLSTHGFM